MVSLWSQFLSKNKNKNKNKQTNSTWTAFASVHLNVSFHEQNPSSLNPLHPAFSINAATLTHSSVLSNTCWNELSVKVMPFHNHHEKHPVHIYIHSAFKSRNTCRNQHKLSHTHPTDSSAEAYHISSWHTCPLITDYRHHRGRGGGGTSWWSCDDLLHKTRTVTQYWMLFM